MRLGVPVRRARCATVASSPRRLPPSSAATFVRGSWDVSESRQNSFGEAGAGSARARCRRRSRSKCTWRRRIRAAVEFERGPLAKLRRVVPHVDVTYVARTSSGLYEQADPGYGEIWYTIGGQPRSSRVMTDEGVLETIFDVAGVSTPAESKTSAYMGHPLVARPTGARTHVLWHLAGRDDRRPVSGEQGDTHDNGTLTWPC